ncbi:hypothetical protein V1478_015550 [Vespula squamosa]|uniref:Uncharacterized protein n=1 Tax=Vespula squamosa TaxID=30214 RepID=A0ABD2A3T7_VESSQ
MFNHIFYRLYNKDLGYLIFSFNGCISSSRHMYFYTSLLLENYLPQPIYNKDLDKYESEYIFLEQIDKDIQFDFADVKNT